MINPICVKKPPEQRTETLKKNFPEIFQYDKKPIIKGTLSTRVKKCSPFDATIPMAAAGRGQKGGMPAYQMVRVTGYKQFPSSNIVMWVMNGCPMNKHAAIQCACVCLCVCMFGRKGGFLP